MAEEAGIDQDKMLMMSLIKRCCHILKQEV